VAENHGEHSGEKEGNGPTFKVFCNHGVVTEIEGGKDPGEKSGLA